MRIRPTFWLLFLFIAGRWLFQSPLIFVGLIAACIVVVVIHTGTKVIAARIFGGEPEVLLSFGFGQVKGIDYLDSRWKRIVVYVAGLLGLLLPSIAALALYMSVVVGNAAVSPWLLIAVSIFALFCLIHFGYEVLPLYQSDMGCIIQEVLSWLMPLWGRFWAFVIGALVAGLIAVNAYFAIQGKPLFWMLHFRSMFAAIFMTIVSIAHFVLAYSTYRMNRLLGELMIDSNMVDESDETCPDDPDDHDRYISDDKH